MTDLLYDDIYNNPVLKSFHDLIIEFDIPYVEENTTSWWITNSSTWVIG